MIELENLKDSFLAEIQWTEDLLGSHLVRKFVGFDCEACPSLQVPKIGATVDVTFCVSFQNREQIDRFLALIDGLEKSEKIYFHLPAVKPEEMLNRRVYFVAAAKFFKLQDGEVSWIDWLLPDSSETVPFMVSDSDVIPDAEGD